MNTLIKYIAGNSVLTIAFMLTIGMMQAGLLIVTMIKISGGL